ncbi:hypothetical protein [Janthinobacterium lividum]|uniref:hypothetical protein n=1 Tax=Janthinobacterium lividum TaxID=29581 RepID=UPI001409A4FF|nr:hypothetical protein [Janthinobacterium lividum]NHQ93336.1 hypothetical protein [Janthinobacterium lividum]
MTLATLQPEGGAPTYVRQGDQQHEHVENELPVDPGHVRTRQHYEAMLQELQGQK